jgi:uncharacterized protein YjbJ (UPF0337 family)
MSGKAEEIKGRVKESVGILTGNEKLKTLVEWTRIPAR